MMNTWKRAFARLFDWGIFYIFGVFLSLVLPIEVDERFYFSFAVSLPVLWAPIEAILTTLWETTPGKALFGIYIRGLTFAKSLKRAFFLGDRPGEVVITETNRWRVVISVVLALMCASTLFIGKDLSDVAIEYEKKITQTTWTPYASDDGRFTVHFPKKPATQEVQQFDIPNGKPLDLKEVKAEKRDISFSVSYLELPKKWRIFSSSTLLKGAIQVVTEHMPGAELIEKKIVKHKNYPAMDFKMKQGDNEIEGRLILVGGTLYKLTVVYPADYVRDGQHETFLNSFEMN